MGEWKVQISFHVHQDLRREMEAFANKERRNLGNFAAVLVEWAWEQLQVAGSLDRLLKFSIKSGRKSNGPFENKHKLQDENRRPGQFAGEGRSGASNPGQPL